MFIIETIQGGFENKSGWMIYLCRTSQPDRLATVERQSFQFRTVRIMETNNAPPPLYANGNNSSPLSIKWKHMVGTTHPT